MMKQDEHGEYDTDAGSPHPVDPDNFNYEPCNAVLKFTWDRYGERRYCTAMAESNFGGEGNTSRFCKHHKSREALMEQRAENFTTGAWSKSHSHTFQHLAPHEKILANDMYKSLLTESTYDFDTEMTELRVDVEDTEFAPDADTLVLEHPVPTEHRIRGKALWHASLDFLTMESIREEQFRIAAQETHEGRDLAVGEAVGVVAVTDDGEEITDTEEHHLNLPLSRISKHYAEHLEFGGVTVDQSDDSGMMSARDWVAVIEPDEAEVQPEAQTSEQPAIEDVELPDED